MTTRVHVLAISLALATSLLFVAATGARAQTSKRLTATPKVFQTFYAKFRRAVLRNDKSAVASMTSFPFEYGWDAGDEGTYSRRQFLAKFNDMFKGTHKLFSRSDPKFYVDGKTFNLTNMSDASHYIFEKKGSTYVFSSFVVEP